MCTVKVGSRSLPLYPLVTVCLGVLNTILMLTAIVIGIYCGNVSELSVPDQLEAQVLFVEAKHIQTMQTEQIKVHEEAKQALQKEIRAHEQLKLQFEQDKKLHDDLQNQLDILTLEEATLQADKSNLQESCGQCPPGWFLVNASCYFHSKSASGAFKNWHDSRADCIARGASLTVIDNLEEQLNLFEYLPKLDPSMRRLWRKSRGIWIGLTDIQTEGSWVWLNNVTLDEGYWISGEPNNNGLMGENCVALMNMKSPSATWFDAGCNEDMEWLCEKEVN
ncbi:C-type lectin domain family 4 member M [Larimichthys crocea]|uniref:Uncharacterized protein n=1 Tax=Larimichthys crocea TaxID=215358 RepID=A0ACD3RS14_LARCR|nr:C-type lectin domain family 4 member M [Larimichthys crocea]